MKKIKKFFDREQNLLIHIIATILVTIFGIIFNLKVYEWLLVYSMVTLVITSELINSAIELIQAILIHLQWLLKTLQQPLL